MDEPFDLHHLSRAIAQARSDHSLTLAELSRQVGVASSTIRRFATAADAEADGVLFLIRWLGVAPERFIADSAVAGVPLQASGDGYIRVDMAAVARLTSNPRRGHGERTTMQRLATAAQGAGVPVASLTRWSAS